MFQSDPNASIAPLTGPVLPRRRVLMGASAGILLGATAAQAQAKIKIKVKAQPEAGAPVPLDSVLSDIHKRTFRYFWETADPHTGLAPDKWPKQDFCSVAAVGFGLSAYVIGANAGYVTRAQAAGRTLLTLRTLWNGPQGPQRTGVMGHKGFFYHFLDMKTGLRYADCELSSVDTALCLAGVLTAAAYFDGKTADEAEIRKLAMAIYGRVDWTFLERDNGLVSMGWHPEPGLPDHDARGLIDRNWDRYNEGMLVYFLALGSPTHPIRHDTWQSWEKTLPPSWSTNFHETYLSFSPLFGHQYSHVWFDFRGIADSFMRAHDSTYFENSQKATIAQRNYAIRNPGQFRDYGPDVWGLTACMGPGQITATLGGRDIHFEGYIARGIQDGDWESSDDGTVAPTGGLSSMPFTPDICTSLAHNLITRYGDDLYGDYGFFDAFNPTFPADIKSEDGRQTVRAGWVASQYLGINQGPILCMLENYRSGLLWNLVCRSPLTGPHVRRAFRLAGFEPVGDEGRWLDARA